MDVEMWTTETPRCKRYYVEGTRVTKDRFEILELEAKWFHSLYTFTRRGATVHTKIAHGVVSWKKQNKK
jgi:hypothetical protein